MKLYFAYGANLNLEGMRFRCPSAHPVSAFLLHDYRLAFSGVATIQPCPGATVPGALWEITQECEDNLDVFEGFPFLYSKIYLTQGNQEFMAYVMNDDPPAGPSRSYFNTIREGYQDWNLPIADLEQARDLTLLECH
jgi:gamma-glutamylcyclotransferase (GGCT)/AIG2-like uncharacterized protein YtfP